MDKFKVIKSDGELCMLMACKNHDTPYAQLILDELKSSSPDLNGLCNSVSEIQQLTKSGSRWCAYEKEVHLSSVEGDGTFKEKCRNCSKVYVDSKPRNAEGNMISLYIEYAAAMDDLQRSRNAEARTVCTMASTILSRPPYL